VKLVRLTGKDAPYFNYTSEDAGTNIPINWGGYTIAGDYIKAEDKGNYKTDLAFESIRGTITQAEFSDLACQAIDCSKIDTEGKTEQEIKEEIIHEFVGTLNLAATATYGDKLTSALIPVAPAQNAWPTTLAGTLTGSWSWEKDGVSVGRVHDTTFTVQFNHTEPNYKPVTGIEASLRVGKKILTLQGTAVTRDYVFDEQTKSPADTVSVVITPAPNSVVPGDENKVKIDTVIATLDIMKSPSGLPLIPAGASGTDLPIKSYLPFAWADGVDAAIQANYRLPSVAGTVSITPTATSS
jgi:hypothetical protein